MVPSLVKAEQDITQAQPELGKKSLTIIDRKGQKHIFSVEIASSLKEQETGEMFRNNIPENGGMLFVWPTPQQSSMWMKNTRVPLDIIFIDQDGNIQTIAENTVPYSLKPISSRGLVRATLELKGGITEKLGILVGDKVDSPALKTQNKQN
ncbi:DUF192 domain-containing protein [Commensalibacter sp. Nvir]|uniref:DUF192 domain-containing protein n=1 Tax=Commensalibacter sp. Nvir TaxID=3069817 RepID=UPI0038CF3CE5